MAFNFNKLCSNVIPVGKYKVQVTDIKFKANSMGESSKDIVVNYTIVDGPAAKRTLMDTIYEKSFSFRLKPFLTACKVDLNREFTTAEELYKYGFAAAKNKIILMDITVRTYNGKEYNNVDNWYPLPDSSTSSEDVLKDFGVDATMKAEEVKKTMVEDLVEPTLEMPELPDTDVFSDDDIIF
jgi:hypothetical protein